MLRPVYWDKDKIRMIDQTLLPEKYVEIEINTPEQLWEAIKSLRVRGAPAIGIAAAFGAALAAHRYSGNDPKECLDEILKTCDYLATSRPTAVNLFWALERMRKKAMESADAGMESLRRALLEEANRILEEDIRMSRTLGKFGADLLQDGDTVLTHCNAGALATGGFGTALGVVYAAREMGKNLRVFADETRPLLQGSRLTAWELMQNGVDVTLICDNMAASVIRDQGVKAVIVGADRIAANGDFANKIGTYGLALLARVHSIPFYTAAPWSTVDMSLINGKDIPIEIRDENEVRTVLGKNATAPEGVKVYNPAFDVTPAEFLTAIITERGVAEAPFEESLRNLDGQG